MALRACTGLYFICLLATHIAVAQTDTLTRIEHAPIVDARANEPVRTFAMRLPFRISPIAGNQEISFYYHAGNTWNPSGVLEYPNASEPYFSNPWNAPYHPTYTKDPHRYQLYSADGVIRSATIAYTKKTSACGEWYGMLNANMLVGGGSFIDAAVSDRAIVGFDKMIRNENPFRTLDGFNLAEMKFTDRDGHSLEIKPRQTYLGTLNVGYRHFFDIVRSTKNKILWTLSTEAQVGVPLNRARNYLSAGIVIGSALTKQFTKKYGVTLAVGYATQHNKIWRTRQNDFNFNYVDVVSGYRFLLTNNFDFKNNQRFTVGIELQGMTAPLSTKERVQAYLNPEDIGIQTNYVTEWTPQNPVALTDQRRASRGLISGSEYLSLNFSYRFGKPGRSSTIMFCAQDDWSLNDFLPLVSSELNNSQDFGVGIKWIQVLP
ncbi:MAG: hypothetical protein JST48_06235 [Bacteroidetes bacterium]|nr:hypothetical protein [Bacteroidota bacterium]